MYKKLLIVSLVLVMGLQVAVFTPAFAATSEDTGTARFSVDFNIIVRDGVIKVDNPQVNLYQYITRREMADWINGYLGSWAVYVKPDYRQYYYLTREELAEMMVTAYEYKTGTSIDNFNPAPGMLYDDLYTASYGRRAYIQAASILGLMEAKTGRSFKPFDFVTRGEAANALKRLYYLVDKNIYVEKYCDINGDGRVEKISVSKDKVQVSNLNDEAIAAAALKKYSYIEDTELFFKDFNYDGTKEIVVLRTTSGTLKYIDVFSLSGNKLLNIFSRSANDIEISGNKIVLVKNGYDGGRAFTQRSTFAWRGGWFVQTNFTVSYSGSTGYKYDERIETVWAYLNAVLDGKYKVAARYLSSDYKNRESVARINRIIPDGVVTAVDTFESKRGDFIIAAMKDFSGRSRVFKFVMVNEKDEYGNYKIDNIIEIPEAK